MLRDEAYINELSHRVIGAAMEVHSLLRPGLLESAYESCLCHELMQRGISFARQSPLPRRYKGIEIEAGYRIDILVDGCLPIELKAVDSVLPLHRAQTLTYLKLSGHWLGLLINFNTTHLKDGIYRIVNGNPP